jgi:hypothetical protein
LESPVSQKLENKQIKPNHVMSWKKKMAPENEKKAYWFYHCEPFCGVFNF